MPKSFRSHIPSSLITPRDVFFNRREFMATAGLGLAGMALPGAAGAVIPEGGVLDVPLSRPDVFPTQRNAKYALPDGIDTTLTPRQTAATHNNYYEFLPGRGGPAWQFTEKFEVEPWKIEIGGLCDKPGTMDLDDIFAIPHEERLYHFRCVERWAMNVPWSGFPLRTLHRPRGAQVERASSCVSRPSYAKTKCPGSRKPTGTTGPTTRPAVSTRPATSSPWS